MYPQTASAEKGQDLKDTKCQRNKADGSSTTGPCEEVCKDLEVSTHKDVDTGLRTCKESSIIALVHPSEQSLKHSDSRTVQAFPLMSKGNEIVFVPATVNAVPGSSGEK
jgi:hypothetical protein